MKLSARILLCPMIALFITETALSQSYFLVSEGQPVFVHYTGPGSAYPPSSETKLTDGIIGSSSYCEFLPGNEGARIVISLSDSFLLTHGQIRTILPIATEYRLRGYEIRTSVDSLHWTFVAADSSVDTTTIDLTFPQQMASFFELTITKMDTGGGAMSTILTEISLFAELDRPVISSVSVAPPLVDTSEYQTITWTSSLWDTSKTVSIFSGSDRQALEVVATNIQNSGSYNWRTSIIPDGPRVVQVHPDTSLFYSREAIATIANYFSLVFNVDAQSSLYNYHDFPILLSGALQDTLRFSWTFGSRFNYRDGQEICFSSDSGATWVTVLQVPDTSTRNAEIPVTDLPAGGERCFLGVSILNGSTRMVTFRHRIPLYVASIPPITMRNWSSRISLNHDIHSSSEMPSQRGLIGYPVANKHWNIIGGLRWLIDKSGSTLGNWNVSLPHVNSVAAADVDHNGVTDIVPYWFYQNSNLDNVPYVLPDTGAPPSGLYSYSKVNGDFQLVDVDSDDSLEIAYASYGGVSLYRAHGEFYRRFTWGSAPGTIARYIDISGTPSPELVVPIGSSLSVFDSVGQVIPPFPATFATIFAGSPLPFDADGDGKPEILAYGNGLMYCVTKDATVVVGFPLSFQGIVASGPSIGDVDADGDLDIVFVLDRNPYYEVRCYDAHGTLLNGWPRTFPYRTYVYKTDTGYLYSTLSAMPAQPLLASIDGDQECEILISTANGQLYIFNADGSDFAGSPYYIGNYSAEAGILGDFDGDGAIEYAYPLLQEYPARNSVACLEFGLGTYNPLAIPWPMYLADATKSGRTNSAVIVGVNEDANQGIPDHFSLSQNYPNPFNPTTTIRYSLPKSVQTTVRVSDMLGRTVATLVDEFRNAGMHTVNFDGSRLASGVYFLHIVAGQDRSVRKMLLMK